MTVRDYVPWYPKDAHGNVIEGPTDIEAGLRICDCGYAIAWNDFTQHQATRDHVLRLIEVFSVTGWDDFIEEVSNGLGWARSEDMSLGRVDHDDVLAILRELTASVVRTVVRRPTR